MTAVTSDQMNGKNIVLLGVSAPITLNATGNTVIFTSSEAGITAPSQVTYVQYVEVVYNGGVGAVPATLQWRFGNEATIAASGDWKNTFVATTFPTNPSVYSALDAAPIYGNGVNFDARVQVGAAAGNTAVVKAYGWTE
jgi:hypothetical protein